MRILLKVWLLLLINSCFLIGFLSAETILLENEEIRQGTITNYSNDSITLETEEGEKEIPISEIHLIDYLGSAKDYQKLPSAQNSYTIYLRNGEILEGTITQFTNEFLTVESLSGHGVLQIPTSQVNFITSGKSRIAMNQRNGVGYLQKKSTLNSSSGLTTYSSDQLSYKFFLSDTLFGNGLLAYGNASYNDTKLQIMAVDFRVGKVFRQFQNTLLYAGLSLGYLQINDDANAIDGTGTALSVFAGAEMFFNALPNFGFSAEIGYGMREAGDYSSSDLSISTFPSFSIHYYY